MTSSNGDKPWEQHPLRTLHACVEQLANRFKGYLPWPEEKRDGVVRGHEMFIEDMVKRADACMVILEHKIDKGLRGQVGAPGGLINEAHAAEAVVPSAVMEWQPIETAPKTGPVEQLLLYVPQLHGTGGKVIAHWAHGGGEEQPPFGPDWFYWTGHGFHDLPRDHKPTHWMRLPHCPADWREPIVSSATTALPEAVPVADIEAEIEHIKQNAEGLRRFAGSEDEARCRELCAMYLREFIQSWRFQQQINVLDRAPKRCERCNGTGSLQEKRGYYGESYTCYTETVQCSACSGKGSVGVRTPADG